MFRVLDVWGFGRLGIWDVGGFNFGTLGGSFSDVLGLIVGRSGFIFGC